MTNRVDWRQQFAALVPFAQGKGGVVHVHASVEAPTNVFLRELRHFLESGSWSKPWTTIQLDTAEDGGASYVAGIVDQIAIAAGCAHGIAANAGTEVSVGSDIRAGGDVTLRDISVSLFVTDSVLVANLCDRLAAFLQDRRLAILISAPQSMERSRLDRLMTMLWDGRLESLVASGLLLLHLDEPYPDGHQSAAWPPPADVVVTLPSIFGEDERICAHADLTEIALNNRLFATRGEAEVFASTLLASNTTVRDLHMSLSLALNGLRPV